MFVGLFLKLIGPPKKLPATLPLFHKDLKINFINKRREKGSQYRKEECIKIERV